MTRLRVVYDSVDRRCLDAEPGTRNLVRLLARVVRGDTPESLARAAGASTGGIAELGDGRLEQSLFTLVQAQGNEKRREFDCYRCGNLLGLLRRLEENEMTWPEKWIEQMRPQFEERIRREFEPKLRQELELKLRRKVEAELELKLRPKVEAELRQELKAELRQKLKAKVRRRVEARVEAELLPKVERELERTLRSIVEELLRAELLRIIEEELRDELREAHRQR